jgi:hypothetical protein
MNANEHWCPDGSGVLLVALDTDTCQACDWVNPSVYDKMIARTQDGPDPLVPEPGPGKGT